MTAFGIAPRCLFTVRALCPKRARRRESAAVACRGAGSDWGEVKARMPREIARQR